MNRPEEISSFLPINSNCKSQKESIENFTSTVEIDIIGSEPINEFNTQFLATMAFPTLFPDGKGDPTNSALLRNISSNELD